MTRLRILKLLLTLLLVFVPSCLSTRVILVPDGTPIQLREDIKAAPVWVYDKDGERVEAITDLPAGWYCLPDTE